MVGGGWAGLAAAVRASEAGHRVTLLEMAGQLGGRARSVLDHGLKLDNGQHILIGAYTRTLALMRSVGSDVDAAFERRPLELCYPDGRGLRLPPGPAWLAFARGVVSCRGWTARERLAMLGAAARWAGAGFRCAPGLNVAELCAGLPVAVRELLIEPLCIAALNTPAHEASAEVWLRVLRDALFSGRGSADLLLPRQPLSALLPLPAARWLEAAGAEIRLRAGSQHLARAATGWILDGENYDAVVLACGARESARLARPHAPHWAQVAQALRFEPIVTVYLSCPGARLPAPMTALVSGADAPAQFAFDQGALGASPGMFALVVSGAAAWVERGLEATGAAALQQLVRAFPAATWPQPPTVLRVLAEKRATFACLAGLLRPPAQIAEGLFAAGDHVDGPYPATLEGAVRSGEAAAALVGT